MPTSSLLDIGGVRVRLDGFLSRLPKGYALGNTEGRAIEVRFVTRLNKNKELLLYIDGDVSVEGILTFAANDIPYLKCDKIINH